MSPFGALDRTLVCFGARGGTCVKERNQQQTDPRRTLIAEESRRDIGDASPISAGHTGWERKDGRKHGGEIGDARDRRIRRFLLNWSIVLLLILRFHQLAPLPKE